MQPCVMRLGRVIGGITQGCIIFPCVQLAATYMSTQNWGHPAQLDYSSVTRPSLPREGLACETTLTTLTLCKDGAMGVH